jgi:hypothetical protein
MMSGGGEDSASQVRGGDVVVMMMSGGGEDGACQGER